MDEKNNSLCKFMVYNCMHLNINSCRCEIKLCVTIFDKYIRVQYQSKDITCDGNFNWSCPQAPSERDPLHTFVCNGSGSTYVERDVKIDNDFFNIENISFPHLTDKNILYLIDTYGKLYVCEIKLENDELFFSKIDCELEIKTKKKINVKSANKN